MITPSDREFYQLEYKHNEKFFQNIGKIRGQYTIQYGPMVYGLIHAINASFIVETGTCHGYLTAWIAKASCELNHRKFITVDWHNERFPHSEPGSDFVVRENLQKCGVLDGVSDFVISEALSWFRYSEDRGELKGLSFVVLDDSKEYHYVTQELEIIWRNLVPGGLLLVHGVENQHDNSVQKAVNDTIKTEKKIIFFTNLGFIIIQKPWDTPAKK